MGLLDAEVLGKRIETDLRRVANRQRAAGAKRYLKSELVFLGADTKAVRETTKAALREGLALDRNGLLALVDVLWMRGVFELRAVAVEALKARAVLLLAEDIGLIERLLRESQTWALVDFIAVHIAGPLVERFPRLCAALDRWAADADFWVRRAAMLALLRPLRRGDGDFPRFARYADAMLGEGEFFIRKASGWVLRETGKKRPELVDAWIAPRIDRASGVTVREAVRYLPQKRKEALMAAYSKGRQGAPGRTRKGV